jgi:hypothetical protein
MKKEVGKPLHRKFERLQINNLMVYFKNLEKKNNSNSKLVEEK